MIGRLTGRPIGFLDWTLLGLPFALASTVVAVEAILLLFLTPEDRRAPLAAPAAMPRPRRVMRCRRAGSRPWSCSAGLPRRCTASTTR